MPERLFYITLFHLMLLCVPKQTQCQSATACSCTIYEDARNNRKPTPQQVLQLEASKDPVCHIRLLEFRLANLMETHKGDTLLLPLRQIDSLIRKLNCSGFDRSSFYRLEAIILHNKGDYAQSLEASLKQLAILEKKDDPYRLAEAGLLVASTFNRLKRSGQGRVWTWKAIGLLPAITNELEQSRICFQLAKRYLWYFQDEKKKILLDSSALFANRHLLLSRKFSDSTQLQMGYDLHSSIAHERGDYVTALRYADSSINYLSAANTGLRGTAYGDKADVLMELKRYPEARRYADSCLAAHKKVGNPETIANAYALIYQISERTSNYKDALDALNAYYEIHDSLTNVNKTKSVTELEKKYNQAKNENTIRELAQEKQIYALLALAILLLLIAVAFYFRQKALRQKQLIMEAEQRLNRSRMNPHFFFNALSSLQAFALKDTDRKELASGLSRFSHIMRETLESTYKEYVTIEQETAFLQEYLELQQLRHPGKFSFSIEIDPELDPELLLLPSMILQPFVENSVEHGFEGISYPGQISIVFSSKDNQLLIRITDNGKGLAPAVSAEPGHVSRAQQIVKDRIYLLRMKLKCNAGFSIRNRPQGNGVEVEILLPELDKSQINHP